VTARQQQYAARFIFDSIYTPQLVVDGREEMIGSDERAVRRAEVSAVQRPKRALRVLGETACACR
jgi:hypothetical protein